MPAAKILVIDDDPDIVDFCREVLGGRGYIVTGAATGAEGIAMASVERPDLVILDIMMEEADSGLRVAGKMPAAVPILMLSSIARASDQVFDTARLPISDFAEKPIAPDVLVGKVEQLLARASRR